MHCEAGILTAEEGHVQPGQPAQVGGASIVDREPCAEPGDRDGCEQGHDRKPVQTAVDHDDPRRLARLVGFLQKTRQRERCAETAGLARIGSDAALRGHEHQHVRFDPLAMVREDGARGFLIRRRRRRLQREVARERSSGGAELLAAGLGLPHEQGAGEPELLADLVPRARAHGGRDDEEARRQNDGKQSDEDGDEPSAEAAEAMEAHLSTRLAGSRYRRRAAGATARRDPPRG